MTADHIKLQREVQRLRLQLQEQKQANQELELKLAQLQAERNNLAFEVQKARRTFLSIDQSINQKVRNVRQQEIAKNNQASVRVYQLQRELAISQQIKNTIVAEKQQLQRRNQELVQRVNNLSQKLNLPIEANSSRQVFSTIEQQKEMLERLTQNYNKLSKVHENAVAQNRVLRKLAEVPESYGFNLEEVKRAQRNQLQDFKHQLRSRELQIEELESERAQLRFRLRELTSAGAKQTLGDLTPEQQDEVNMFVLALKEGRTHGQTRGQAQQQIEQLRSKLAVLEHNRPRQRQDTAEILLARQNKELREMIMLLQEGSQGNPQHRNKSRVSGRWKQEDNIQQSRIKTISEVQSQLQPVQLPPAPRVLHAGQHAVQGFSVVYDTKFKIELQKLDATDPAKLRANLLAHVVELSHQLKQRDQAVHRLQEQVEAAEARISESVSRTQGVLARMKLDRQQQQYKSKTAQSQARKLKLEVQVLQAKIATLEQTFKGDEAKLRLAISQQRALRFGKQCALLQSQNQSLASLVDKLSTKDRADYLQHKRIICNLRQAKNRLQAQVSLMYQQLKTSVKRQECQLAQGKLKTAQERLKQLRQKTVKMAEQLSEHQLLARNKKLVENELSRHTDMGCSMIVEYQIVANRLALQNAQFAKERKILRRLIDHCNQKGISLSEQFMKQDKSLDFELDHRQLLSLLQSIGFSSSAQDCTLLINHLDVDFNLKLSVNQFLERLLRNGLKNYSLSENIIEKLAEALTAIGFGIEDAFNAIDTNGNGQIQFNQIATAFKEMGISLTAIQLKQFWDYANYDRSKSISRAEFHSAFNRAYSRTKTSKLLASDRLDWRVQSLSEMAVRIKGGSLSEQFSNREGKLTQKELHQLFLRLGVRITEKQSNDIFITLDKDKSNTISYEQLRTELQHAKNQAERFKRLKLARERQAELFREVDQSAYLVRGVGEREEVKSMTLAIKNQLLQKKIANLNTQLARRQAELSEFEKRAKQSEEEAQTVSQLLIVNRQKLITAEHAAKYSESAKRAQEQANQNLLLRNQNQSLKAGMHTFKSLLESVSTCLISCQAQSRLKDQTVAQCFSIMREQSKGKGENYTLLKKLEAELINARRQAILLEENSKRVENELNEATGQYLREQQRSEDLFIQLVSLRKQLIQKQSVTAQPDTQADLYNKKQQQIHDKLVSLMNQRHRLQREKLQLEEQNVALQLKVGKMAIKQQQVEKLSAQLKGNNRDQLSVRLIELAQKNSQLKVAELRLNRQAGIAQQKLNHYMRLFHGSEETIKSLQNQISTLQTTHNAREQFWRLKLGDQAKRVSKAVEQRLQQQKTNAKTQDYMLRSQKNNQNKQKQSAFLKQMDFLKKKIEQQRVEIQNLKDGGLRLAKSVIFEDTRQGPSNRYINAQESKASALEHQLSRMREAAQQSINTLQSLINAKNEEISHKQRIILDLHKQSTAAAERHEKAYSDLESVCESLRTQLYSAKEQAPLGPIKMQQTLHMTELERNPLSDRALKSSMKSSKMMLQSQSQQAQNLKIQIVSLEKQNAILKRAASKTRPTMQPKDNKNIQKLLKQKEQDIAALQKSFTEIKGKLLRQIQQLKAKEASMQKQLDVASQIISELRKK